MHIVKTISGFLKVILIWGVVASSIYLVTAGISSSIAAIFAYIADGIFTSILYISETMMQFIPPAALDIIEYIFRKITDVTCLKPHIILLILFSIAASLLLGACHTHYADKSTNADLTFKMPQMRPLPIHTKNQPNWVRMWRWLTAIRSWRTTEDWYFTLPEKSAFPNQKIFIPKGFVFDGASIPRPFWALLSPTGLLLIPGLIHDYGYRNNYLLTEDCQKIKVGMIPNNKRHDKTVWDILFLDVSIAVSSSVSTSIGVFITLYFFGWCAWFANRRARKAAIDKMRQDAHNNA